MSAYDDDSDDGWSGDPFCGATPQQLEYAKTALLRDGPSPGRLTWSLIPAKAAIVLSFIRCIEIPTSYNDGLHTCLLPGERSMLVGNSIVGYRSGPFDTLYLLPQGELVQSMRVCWGRCLSAITRVLYIKERGGACRGLWERVLRNELHGIEVGTLTKDRQSRLEWELRMREMGG